HNEGLPVVVFDFEDGADVGMVQLRRSTRLTLEALERLLVIYQIFRDELEGDVSAKAGVFGFIDNSHAAATEFTQNAVVGDRLADHEVFPRLSADNVRTRRGAGQLSYCE